MSKKKSVEDEVAHSLLQVGVRIAQPPAQPYLPSAPAEPRELSVHRFHQLLNSPLQKDKDHSWTREGAEAAMDWMVDGFTVTLIEEAIQAAKHRGSDTVEEQDIAFAASEF